MYLPHKNFELHFSENVDFETPPKVSEVGKEHLRQIFSTQLSSETAMK